MQDPTNKVPECCARESHHVVIMTSVGRLKDAIDQMDNLISEIAGKPVEKVERLGGPPGPPSYPGSECLMIVLDQTPELIHALIRRIDEQRLELREILF